MGKPTICIGENKDADQLRGNREADQRLCFRYSDSTIPLLLKSEISSFWLFSVLVQVGLCRTCSKTTLLVFQRGGSYVAIHFLSKTLIIDTYILRRKTYDSVNYLPIHCNCCSCPLTMKTADQGIWISCLTSRWSP